MAGTYMRKKYLIKNGFQLKYTLSIVALLMIAMLVSGTALYLGVMGSVIENFSKFRVSEDLEAAKRVADGKDNQYKQENYNFLKIFKEAAVLSDRQKQMMEDALKDINKSLLPKVLLLFVAIIAAGILISHRIAGPMHKIEESARAIQRGDLNVNFKIRKSDEMQETALALNDMAKSLHEDIKRIKEAGSALDAKVNTLTGRLPDEDVKGIKTLISEASSILSKYKT